MAVAVGIGVGVAIEGGVGVGVGAAVGAADAAGSVGVPPVENTDRRVLSGSSVGVDGVRVGLSGSSVARSIVIVSPPQAIIAIIRTNERMMLTDINLRCNLIRYHL